MVFFRILEDKNKVKRFHRRRLRHETESGLRKCKDKNIQSLHKFTKLSKKSCESFMKLLKREDFTKVYT